MNAVNAVMNVLGNLLIGPFAGLPAWVALVFWSAVSGPLMALAFKYTSNQKALTRVTDRIRANMLAMKLFKDDLGVTFKCQVSLFKNIGLRLLHSLPPMLVLIAPFVLILSQFGAWYQFRPLLAGESVIVEVGFSQSAWATHQDATLEVPEHVTVETPALRDARSRTISWRIRPSKGEPFEMKCNAGGATFTKRVAVADDVAKLMIVSVKRPGGSFWERLLYPTESAFDSTSAVREIRVIHWPGTSDDHRLNPAERSTTILWMDIPWWITFLIVSMLAAFLSKPWVKVQF